MIQGIKSDKDNPMIKESKLISKTLGPGESGSRVFFYGQTEWCRIRSALIYWGRKVPSAINADATNLNSRFHASALKRSGAQVRE
jgi:hypothetical protein